MPKRLANIFVRSLCFAIASAVVAACNGGATPQTLPQNTNVNNGAMPITDPVTPSSTAQPDIMAAVPAAAQYTWHGCRVYPANDWFTTNLLNGSSSYVSHRVDPNSARIIQNFASAWPNARLNVNGMTVSIPQAANVASSTTSLYKVSGTTMIDDPWRDDSANVIPFQTGFLLEGRSSGSCSGDCHGIVMTPSSRPPSGTRPCVDYETYNSGGTSFSGGSFIAEHGYVHNLNYPYNEQLRVGGPDQAGIPQLGTVDLGEDASLPFIPHIAKMGVPGTDGDPTATGNWVVPANTGKACQTSCRYTLPMGARLRLNPSKYTCPSASSYPQAHLLCVQLETYGAIVADHNGSAVFNIILGLTSSGMNPWHENDLAHLNGIPMSDFDVMTLGTVH